MNPIAKYPNRMASIAMVKKTILSFLFLFVSHFIFAQPVINSFTPASGPPGTVMIITGSGFNATASNNIVYFGPVKASVVNATASSLTVTVPFCAGQQPFSVTTGGLTGYSGKSFMLSKPGLDPLDQYTLTEDGSRGTWGGTWEASKNDIAAMDLNGDGKPDLLTPQWYANTMNLWTNTSGGRTIGFNTSTISNSIGAEGRRVVAGDLNGDGVPEIIVAKERTDAVSIYSNAVASLYSTTVQYSPGSIAIADLDRDGRPDVVIGCIGSANMVVLRNTSTGSTLSFTKQTIGTSDAVRRLAVRDMDGDGLADVCYVPASNGGLTILRNTYTTGNLSFSTTAYTIPGTQRDIQVEDVDGDDKPDVVATGSATGLYVLLNTSTAGAVSLAPTATLITNAYPSSVAIGDIDGDAKPELAIGFTGTSEVTVFKNNCTTGTVNFTGVAFPIHLQVYSILINDFNGDGKNDIAISSEMANTIYVLRNVSNEPEIFSFTPTEGDATTTVTITGRNFKNVSKVDFGGTTASSHQVLSTTSITAIPGATGADGNVTVTTADGFATMQYFNFLKPPTITSFSPTSGTNGTNMNINGTNFFGISSVTIGGVRASIQYTNPAGTLIQVTVRAGATGDVVVTTTDGVATKTGFTYYEPPTITSFTPTSGKAGDIITITGTNFTGLQQVMFGNTFAISPTVVSSTTTEAKVPVTGASGNVSVRTPGGTATLAGFTWLSTPPAVTSFTPAAALPGTYITITGTNFIGITGVQFGGVAATYFNVDAPTSITALVPNGIVGTVDVTLTGSAGNGVLGGFTILSTLPVVTSFTPASGPPGTTVTINGGGFNATAANNIVYFGPVRATVVSATVSQLIVTVPYSAGHRPFSVTANNATAYSARPFIVSQPGLTALDAFSLSTRTSMGAYAGGTQDLKRALTLVDLNADGKPDLLTTNENTANLSQFTNSSNVRRINFQTSTQSMNIPIGSVAEDITSGDLNSDGVPEVVVAKQVSNAISIYDNNLNEIIAINVSGGPVSPVITDINSDGKPDIIIGASRAPFIDVLINSGTAALNFTRQTIALPASVQSIAVRDIDGDGALDICATSSNLNFNSYYILRNTSSSSINFTTSTYSSPAYNGKVKLEDLDGDNKPELVITNPAANSFSVLLNTSIPGAISFDTPVDYTVSATTTDAAIGDIDGDGKPEIAIGKGDNSIEVFKNNSSAGALSFTGVTYNTAGLRPYDMAINDFDGDGKNDVVSISEFSNIVYVLRNVIDEPEIISFTPTQGDVNTLITITGRNFNNVTGVTIGGLLVASHTVVSPTTITATPAVNTPDGNIRVTTLNGPAELGNFNFLNPPTITSFTPTVGTTGGRVTIFGTRLNSVSEVTLGGVRAAISYVYPNNNQMEVIIGAGATGNVVLKSQDGNAVKSGFVYVLPPTITSFTPTTAHAGDVVTITGTNLDYVRNVTFGTWLSNGVTSVSPTTIQAVVPNGSGTVNVGVTTYGGSASLAGFSWLPPTPTITSFTPTSGGPATVITITGTNFTGVTDVSIGGVPVASITVVNDNTITVVITYSASGDVTVTSPSGTASLPGFTYTQPVPTITSFTPTAGIPGDVITITGTGFSFVTNVTIGGVTANPYSVVDPTNIIATVGVGANGDVTVATMGGIATLPGFTLIQPPAIVNFLPKSARTGDQVTITGSNFTNATTVSFGGTPATSFAVVSPNIITAIVGNGSSGDVLVANRAGTAAATGFTYLTPTVTPPAPSITAISPARATTGDVVTITGNHFSNASVVSFGGTAAASFTVVSPTTITAVVGNGSSGDVQVNTPDGTALFASFVYVPPVVPEPVTTLTVYPNPTTGYRPFWVKHPASTTAGWLRIHDMTGKLVKVVIVPAGATLTQVVAPALKAGFYEVSLFSGMQRMHKTLMVW